MNLFLEYPAPAYVFIVDDQGADHKMAGKHIREVFGTGKEPHNTPSSSWSAAEFEQLSS